MCSANNASDNAAGIIIFSGLAIMGIGSLSAWLGYILLYAFGELVDRTCLNEQHNKEIKEHIKRIPISPNRIASNTDHSWLCNSCGNMISEDPYPFCGNTNEGDNSPQAEAETKNCPNCGYAIDNDSLFCTNCGTKII